MTEGSSEKTTMAKELKKEDSASSKNAGKNSLIKVSLALTSLFSLALCLAALAASYLLWQQINNDNASLQASSTRQQTIFAASQQKLQLEFQQQIQMQIKQLSETNKTLSAELLTLQADNRQLEQQIQNNSAVLHRDQRGWQLKEAEYILRIGQHRLLLDRDIEGAAAALTATDKRLSELNKIDLLPLRKSIARQLQKLASYPAPDYIGIQLKLDNLIIAFLKTYLQEVNKTAEKNTTRREQTTTSLAATQNDAVPDRNFLAETLDRAKDMLNQNVKLRHHDQPQFAFPAQQELIFSFQFIQEKLATAKFAVSSRNDPLYKQQLESAINWLTNEQPLKADPNLLAAIKTLSAISLEPTLPDISAPYKMLEKLSAPKKEPTSNEPLADRESL